MTTSNSLAVMATHFPDAEWRKSSYSDDGTNCVEVADLRPAACGAIAVRDSKDPEGPALLFPPIVFAAFVRSAAEGRFDL